MNVIVQIDIDEYKTETESQEKVKSELTDPTVNQLISESKTSREAVRAKGSVL